VKRAQFCETSASAMVRFAKVSDRAKGTNRNWKKYRLPSLLGSILLAMVVLAPSASQATLITYEGFPYPALGPATIDGQTNGIGWEFGWGGDGLGSAAAYAITNGSVADPNGLLYTFSNSVYSAGGFAGRFFSAPGTWANPLTTNYFSIVIKPTVTPATNHFYGLQIYSNGANTGNGVDLLVGKNGSGLNWGLESGVGTDAYSTVAAQLNQPVLLVLRVIFNPTGVFGTPDSYALYVNPTPGQPEPATPDATMMGDIGNQNGIQLDDGNGGAAFFDEIRIGATFASVTPTSNNSSDPNLISWEPFAYNQGFSTGVLDGQPNDGTQDSNGWDNVTWDGAGLFSGETNFTMLAGSLSDPSGKLLTSGNSVHTASTNNSFFGTGRYNVYTVLPAKTNANPTYYSFLLRVDNLGSTNIGTSGAAYLSIFGPANNNLLVGYLFGSSAWGLQSSTNQNLSTVPVVSNQTALLVVRANYAPPGNPFPILLYVNPTPGAPEPATANATNIWTQMPEQNGLALVVQNGAAATFDEIRVGTNYADVTPAVTVNTNAFNITSVAVAGSNVLLMWNTTGGNTNVVQASAGSNGSYNSNSFVNISGQMIIAGSGGVTANYTDVGGATNRPSRYYRIQKIGQ
jgi:hypothetical protein